MELYHLSSSLSSQGRDHQWSALCITDGLSKGCWRRTRSFREATRVARWAAPLALVFWFSQGRPKSVMLGERRDRSISDAVQDA